jgi:hypothetical protein
MAHPDRFIGDDDSTSEQQLVDIAVAEAKAKVQPDAMADALGWKPRVCVWVGWCGRVHHSLKTLYWSEERAFLSRGAMVAG